MHVCVVLCVVLCVVCREPGACHAQIVLKPMKTLYVATSKGSSTRAIVKKKTKQFSEENQCVPPMG